MIPKIKKASLAIKDKVDAMKMHQMFCHSYMKQVRDTASNMGMDINNIEDYIDCEDCKVAKAI